jgi:hypothetical protein
MMCRDTLNCITTMRRIGRDMDAQDELISAAVSHIGDGTARPA